MKWQTASELNNEGFQVQRSYDTRNWTGLAFIPGNGSTQVEHSYSHFDERPLPGVNYYRLKQMDFDGQFKYSEVISVKVKGEGSGISLFPNPANGSVTLALESGYTSAAILTLYNLLGKQMKQQVLPLESGAFRTDIDLSGLPCGIYLAEVRAGKEKWLERLVVD